MPTYSYRNLIDIILDMQEDSDLKGSVEDQFKNLLTAYFFRDECREKPVNLFFKTLEIPSEVKKLNSLLDATIADISAFTQIEPPNDTICGKVMMSKQYLKTFFSNHQPEYKKMPPVVQMELLDKIKEKNESILYAFSKMNEDIEAGKSRKMSTLAALIINNVHLKNGIPYAKMTQSVDEIISGFISNGDKVFQGKPQDMVDFNDDSKIKNLIKAFFPIKQHKDLMAYSELFKNEFKRFQRRAKLLG